MAFELVGGGGSYPHTPPVDPSLSLPRYSLPRDSLPYITTVHSMTVYWVDCQLSCLNQYGSHSFYIWLVSAINLLRNVRVWQRLQTSGKGFPYI